MRRAGRSGVNPLGARRPIAANTLRFRDSGRPKAALRRMKGA